MSELLQKLDIGLLQLFYWLRLKQLWGLEVDHVTSAAPGPPATAGGRLGEAGGERGEAPDLTAAGTRPARAARRRASRIAARAGTVALAAVALGAAAAPATAAPGTTPDGSRAYELVSTGDKNADGVLPGVGFGTGPPLFAADGDHAVFIALTGFIGAHTAPVFQNYGARRTAEGWTWKPLTPAPPAGSTGTVATGGDWGTIGWTSNFQTEFATAYDASWDPDDRDAQPGSDLYASDGGAIPSWVSRGSGPKLLPDAVQYEGSSADGRYVAFRTATKLDPREEDPNSGRQSGEGLYVRDREAGTTKLVPVGAGGSLLSRCGVNPPGSNSGVPAANAVSRDGDYVFFRSGYSWGSGAPCSASAVNGQLYVHRDGEPAQLVSPSTRSTPDPAGRAAAEWRTATPSGSDVFFVSNELKTNDATITNALYRFQLPTAAHPDGVLTNLTPRAYGGATALDQSGPPAISTDGSVVAFASTTALTADAPVDGTAKLYRYSGDQLRFVGVVASDAWSAPKLLDSTLALSADGSKLAFTTAVRQPGAPDHSGVTQAYVAETTGNATPVCASCGTGDQPTGPASIGGTLARVGEAGTFSRNPVINDGTLFFQTTSALVREDTNGRGDVYERRPDGSFALITPGRTAADGEFVGASADGRSVAFTTAESLTWDDVDNGDADLYVARVGGGFAPPAPPQGCDGDVCQGQPTPQAQTERAASAFVVGSGNLVPPKDQVFGGSSKLTVQAVTARERRSFAAGNRLNLRLRVTRGGTATVTARARIGKQTRTVARATQRKQAAGGLKLGLRLSTAARRELTRTGRLRVTITVRHTGASPRTTAFTLTTKKGR